MTKIIWVGFLLMLNPICYYVTHTYTNFWTELVHLPHTIKSIFLCLKYPFLYPRNRFTNRHWTWYWLDGYIKKLYSNSVSYGGELGSIENPFHRIITNKWEYCYYVILRWTHDNLLQIFHCIPTYNELDGMPEGWCKTIGLKMCQDVKDILLSTGYSPSRMFEMFFAITISARSPMRKFRLYQYIWRRSGIRILYAYRIMDIKEKYGILVWDGNFGNRKLWERISYYENLTEKICIVCGKPTEWQTTGWIENYCNECVGKDKYRSIKVMNENRQTFTYRFFVGIDKICSVVKTCKTQEQLYRISKWGYSFVDRHIQGIKAKMNIIEKHYNNKMLEDIRLSYYDYLSTVYSKQEELLDNEQTMSGLPL